MTLAEKWEADGYAKGYAKGYTKGYAEGRAEARAEGYAELFCKLLTLRFGELAEPIVRRITSASEVERDRWVERLLTADTLDAVLRD